MELFDESKATKCTRYGTAAARARGRVGSLSQRVLLRGENDPVAVELLLVAHRGRDGLLLRRWGRLENEA